jgi:hypothetical protein
MEKIIGDAICFIRSERTSMEKKRLLGNDMKIAAKLVSKV